MPNWVYCNVNVSGPAEDMAAFRAAARKGVRFYPENSDSDWGDFTDIQLEALMQEAARLQEVESKDEFDFHSLYPVPLAVQVMPYDDGTLNRLIKSNPAVAAFCKKYDVVSGYDWERMNWGVKWGDCQTEITDESPESFSLYFETAWSPPHEFWKKVSADYPTLTISMDYSEEMSHFAGESEYHGGEAYINEWQPDLDDDDVEGEE